MECHYFQINGTLTILFGIDFPIGTIFGGSHWKDEQTFGIDFRIKCRRADKMCLFISQPIVKKMRCVGGFKFNILINGGTFQFVNVSGQRNASHQTVLLQFGCGCNHVRLSLFTIVVLRCHPFFVVRGVVFGIFNVYIEGKENIFAQCFTAHATAIHVHGHRVSLGETEPFENDPIEEKCHTKGNDGEETNEIRPEVKAEVAARNGATGVCEAH